MRKQLVLTVEDILKTDEKTILLLGDIGVHGFRKAFALYPDRVFNIGILEQSTVGVAAGLAMEGFIPTFHTIAPFITERALEQLKIDFGYQKLGGNFVSVGASYDYASLGCTHHCPGDVQVLQSIPGMQIVIPGTAAEFDLLYRQTYANQEPTYFRLSDKKNKKTESVEFGRATIIKAGTKGTVLVVGPVLDAVVEACTTLDVTILYYTTVFPFDSESLKKHCTNGCVALVEPFYEGTLAYEVQKSLSNIFLKLTTIGVPRKFLTAYGSVEEHDVVYGFTAKSIYDKLRNHFLGLS